MKNANSPQTPNVSQAAVKTKKAINQYVSVADRRDFGPLKSGSYWYFSPIFQMKQNKFIWFLIVKFLLIYCNNSKKKSNLFVFCLPYSLFVANKLYPSSPKQDIFHKLCSIHCSHQSHLKFTILSVWRTAQNWIF